MDNPEIISPRKLAELWNCECVYCGEPAAARDHLTPQCMNGSHGLENLAPACKHCNSEKGRKTIEDFAGLEKAASIRAMAQKISLLYPGYVFGVPYKEGSKHLGSSRQIRINLDTLAILRANFPAHKNRSDRDLVDWVLLSSVGDKTPMTVYAPAVQEKARKPHSEKKSSFLRLEDLTIDMIDF